MLRARTVARRAVYCAPGVTAGAAVAGEFADPGRYRALFESITEYALIALEPDGTIRSWNPGARRMFGYEQTDIWGLPFATLFTPEDVAAGKPEAELALARATGRARSECWHVRSDGSCLWSTNTLQPMRDEAGGVTGFVKVVRDGTERDQSAEALSHSEERYRVMVESVEDYAIVTTSNEGIVTHWNRGAEKLFGYAAEEIVGKAYALTYSANDIAADLPSRELLEANATGRMSAERWHVRKDGSRFFAAEQVTQLTPDAAGARRGFVRVAHDITDRMKSSEAMRHAASHDRLTGLANRASFIESLQRILARFKRKPIDHFAVFFIDIDNFKAINDTYGHALADSLLVEFARRLERTVRPEDLVARLGGDEFTILLARIEDAEGALAVAERVKGVLAEPFVIDDVLLTPSASTGIAVGSAHYERPEHALRDADIAMYEAKARGSNQYALFDHGMLARTTARRTLEKELREAVEREEFELRYEPVVALARADAPAALVGFEALVSWRHPQRGLLESTQFMPVARKAGTVVEIDRFALRAATRALARWQREAVARRTVPTLAIEISARQFALDDFADFVCKLIDEFALAPGSLHLEIEERALAENVTHLARGVARLARCNAELHVRGFGTGRSALADLRRFSARAIKIDRSFVSTMLDDPDSAAMVRTLVALADGLQLRTIAEGVASADEAEHLRELGCQYAQGPLFQGDLTDSAATELLREA